MENVKRPLLSISMLVSNRIDTIEKCMESLKPLLEGFPCELVVVDTVGPEHTDGSIDVVRRYTDKIYRFEWCNDFAAARNFGLNKCTGEWFMFLDDDEWFEDATEIADFFISGEYKKYNCATYKIHDYINWQGDFIENSKLRMVKVGKDTRFVEPIHEYLAGIQKPVKVLSSYLHHYGYVFDSDEDRKKHADRNLNLLLPEFEKNPWNMHVRAQLLQEYLVLRNTEEGDRLCEDTFSADKNLYAKAYFQWILAAYVRSAVMAKDWQGVLERASMLRKRFPFSSIAELAISTEELKIHCQLKQYEQGVQAFERLMKKRNFLLHNPDQRLVMISLDFENYLSDNEYSKQLTQGIHCYVNTGNTAKATQLTKEFFDVFNRPVLTIFTLVSNRINTIRKCMESLQWLRKAVPSELLVVDTVGEENSDGSLAVAKEYGAKVISFPWEDDFSAARNAALKEAKGAWVLYLDDDEWFENTEEIEQFFVSGEFLSFNSAAYQIRNYKDASGMEYTLTNAHRMVHLREDTRFIGCVNENFERILTPVKQFEDYVHHYGFVYDNAEQKQKRMQMVRRLMEKDLTNYPNYLSNRARLAVVLSIENPKRAYEVCRETLNVCRDGSETMLYQEQITLLFHLFEKLGNKIEAEEQYLLLQKDNCMQPTTEQIVCYRLTRIMAGQGCFERAYFYAKQYFALEGIIFGEQLEIPAEFSKYYTGECRNEMLHMGGFFAWKSGEYEDAWECYEAMPWEEESYQNEEDLQMLWGLFQEYADMQKLLNILKRVMKNPAMVQKAEVRKNVADILALLK